MAMKTANLYRVLDCRGDDRSQAMFAESVPAVRAFRPVWPLRLLRHCHCWIVNTQLTRADDLHPPGYDGTSLTQRIRA